MRNLRSGNQLGASQVTAVVSRDLAAGGIGEYPVMFRAELVAPYFVRLNLAEPITWDDALAS